MEFEHVCELLRSHIEDLPRSKIELAGLLDLLIADAKLDLMDHQANWKLSDFTEVRALIAANEPPKQNEVFARSVLDTLENAAAEWLADLLMARELIDLNPSIDGIIEKGRRLITERISNALLDVGWQLKTKAATVSKLKAGGRKGGKRGRTVSDSQIKTLLAREKELGTPGYAIAAAIARNGHLSESQTRKRLKEIDPNWRGPTSA